MENFDVKTLARSLSKLMGMADDCISHAGGAIHAERLVDYCSDELRRIPEEQIPKVLAEVDKDFLKSLLKDEAGEIIGYVYSKKIFVGLRSVVEPIGHHPVQQQRFDASAKRTRKSIKGAAKEASKALTSNASHSEHEPEGDKVRKVRKRKIKA